MSHHLDINSATYMQPVRSPSDLREDKCLLSKQNLFGTDYNPLHKGEGSTPTVWQVFGSDSRNAANPEMVPRAALLRRRPCRVRMRGDEIVDRGLHAALLVRDAGERQRHSRCWR